MSHTSEDREQGQNAPLTPGRPTYKLGHLTSFIPLNDEASVSTRGQRLQSLIQSRSSRSLFQTHRREQSYFSPYPMQRDKSIDGENDRGLTRDRRGSNTSHHSQTDDEDTYYGTGHPLELNSSIVDFSPTARRRPTSTYAPDVNERRQSTMPESMMTAQMRSMRLIGNSNPRYRWHQYYKTDEELKKMAKPLRKYYERNNYLIAQYIYIDKLLDSSLPHNLIQEYTGMGQGTGHGEMGTIHEESGTMTSGTISPADDAPGSNPISTPASPYPHESKVKRTPKNLYKLPSSEQTPLLQREDDAGDAEAQIDYGDIKYEQEEAVESNSPVVTIAIYINLAANVILLGAKIAVILLTSSLSVLASLVDAALDFLSTAIVWTTTRLISRNDQYAYPIGRRRLEPVGVLVFSIIMITSFFQVALECINRLISDDREVVELGIPAIAIMVSTVLIKGFCWFWCRLVKNSSVQALAQDAVTDVVFNTFSIIFPLVGFYARIWWLDPLGGLLLSLYVIFNWAQTSSEHVRNLCGAAASKDQRNVLLYLTMRFAKTIKSIQGLQAYHAGDYLNVEVDIVLDENTSLRDSHDLSESLQYVLESVPAVDRAFVHADYASRNLPSHMNQQSED